MILEPYLLVAASLFCIGLYGILTSRNVVRVLMSLELMLNGVNLNFVTFSSFLDPYELKGQVFAIFVMAIAAAEAAIGLAIIVVYYRNSSTIRVEEINSLKG